MAVGLTTTGSLADSLPLVIDSANTVREFVGVYSRVCEMQRVPQGTGLSWEEVTLAQLNAESITETTELDNPQQITDSILTLTPTQVGIQVRITDKAKHRISPKVLAKTGVLAQQAMDRYKNDQYLTLLDSATTSLSGAGTTLDAGVIGAAHTQIIGNTTAPGSGAVYSVLHPYQKHDIETQILSGVGTYTIPAGLTEEVFRRGFSGMVRETMLYTDGNITIDGSADAKGGVHAREAVLCVQGMSPRGTTVRKEHIGGGAEDMFLYDDFIFGERHAGGGSSGGGWLYEIYSDATAPTA